MIFRLSSCRRRAAILGLMAVISVCQWATTAEAAPPAVAKRPRVRVTISKQTTYITEPLRPDGYPDYLAALNRRAGRDVKPDSNAVVLLRCAVGPADLAETIRGPYFQRLGISTLPAGGDYFIDFYYFIDREKKGGRFSLSEAEERSLLEEELRLMSQPWSRKKYPFYAGWLAANEKPLKLLTEAANRPRYYAPFVAESEDAPLADVLALPGPKDWSHSLPPLGMVRALLIRAMSRSHDGDLDGAWQDILTCHRWSRLAARGLTCVATGTGMTIEEKAAACAPALLIHRKLSAARVARMRADLAALPPIPSLAEKFEFDERFLFLDALCAMARGRFEPMHGLNHDREIKLLDAVLTGYGPAIDWDTTLRIANSWYDRLAQAAATPNRAERERLLAQIEQDHRDLKAEATSPFSLDGQAGKALGRRVAQIFVGLHLPATDYYWAPFQSAFRADDRWITRTEVHNLAFALAAYRIDHGAYPEKLPDLLPRYVSSVPQDVFNGGADLRYKRRGDGFLLYSVGPNGQDDGGLEWGETDQAGNLGNWDDIAIRVAR